MAFVDKKYAQNLELLNQRDVEKAAFESNFLASNGDRLTSEQREELRNALSQIDEAAKARLKPIDRAEWGQAITTSSANAFQKVAYGFSRIGGIRAFETADEGDEGQFLHQFITLTGHQIDRITDLILDGEKVQFPTNTDSEGRRIFGWSNNTTYPNYVFLSAISRGAADQSANIDLVQQSNILFPGLWTDQHRQRGWAGIYLILLYIAEKFINGRPEIAVEGFWKNDIFDPRDELYKWTDNAALIRADYLVNSKFGPKFKLDDLNLDSLAEAADICDEAVPTEGGGSEKRYTINGSFLVNSANSHAKISADMDLAMGGKAAWFGGKWSFQPGKWRMPVKELDARHFRSSLNIQFKPESESIINGVKGLFRNVGTYWEPTEYAPVYNSFYREQDGGQEFWLQVDYQFVTSLSQAQRCSKILLEASRQWITVAGTFSAEALLLTVGDNVELTYPRLGWDKKHFKVVDLNPVLIGPMVEVFMLLRETAEGIYDWDREETVVDLAPNTNLPNPNNVIPVKSMSVESGTAVLDLRSDGTVFSRAKISWELTKDQYVLSGGSIEIEYKRSADATWRPGPVVGGRSTHTYILDVQDATAYDFRARQRTQLGSSNWSEVLNHFVEGKSAAPTTPSAFGALSVAGGFDVSWMGIPDKDLREYEVRVGVDWESGSVLFKGRSTSFRYTTPLTVGEYKLWLAAIDTSGNYSAFTTLTLDVVVPGAPMDLTAGAIYNSVRLRWSNAIQGSFQVAKYRIYSGTSLGSAVKLDEVSATFATFNEQSSGVKNYLVTAIDEFGNESAAAAVSIDVRSFDFLEIIEDLYLDPTDATLTHAVAEHGHVVAPVNTADTYEQHFTNESWSTLQDQITAGYPIVAQPTEGSTAEIVYEYDYGSVIASAGISMSYAHEWVSGDGTIVNTIAFSNDGISWTDDVGLSIFGESFQYVRLTIELTGDDDTSLCVLEAPRLLLEVALETESGILAVNAGDAGGTQVTFSKTFLDIKESETEIAAVASSPYYATHVFVGNDLFIFLWDSSDARVSGNVKWKVEGIVST